MNSFFTGAMKSMRDAGHIPTLTLAGRIWICRVMIHNGPLSGHTVTGLSEDSPEEAVKEAWVKIQDADEMDEEQERIKEREAYGRAFLRVREG